jgi:dihydrofolate reductase
MQMDHTEGGAPALRVTTGSVSIPEFMHVTLIAAQSLDGFITRHDETTPAFTSEADRVYFARALREFDCSVLGGVTYRAQRDFFLQHLTPTRRRVVLTRDPDRHAADARDGCLEFTSSPPTAVLARLGTAGHRRCALLGGAQIHSLFFAAGLVDELWLTLEPRLFAGGTPLLAQRTDIALQLLGAERLPDSHSLLVKYHVVR